VQPDGTTKSVDAQFLDASAHARSCSEACATSLRSRTRACRPTAIRVRERGRSLEGTAPDLVPNYLSERVSTIESRKEARDDTWPPRKLWMWSTRDGKRRAIELPGESNFTFNEIGWAPDATALRLPADVERLPHARDLDLEPSTASSSPASSTTALDRRADRRRALELGRRRILFGSEAYLPSTTPGTTSSSRSRREWQGRSN
jgi:hypothetical protein